MLIIPAIDIKDGRCVRLFQGEMDKETIYFDRPIDAARHWVEGGRDVYPRCRSQRSGGRTPGSHA